MSVFRPELHVTADQGILEAAAGTLRNRSADGDDVWHAFFQYRPTADAPSRLGHCVSVGSSFDWIECNDTVAPIGGEIAVRAGSVVANRDGVDLYFTSVTEAGTSIQISRALDLTALCEDVDDDYQVDPAIMRVGDVVSNEGGFRRFRSPCVVPDWQEASNRDKGQAGWLMLAMTGEASNPVPVVLDSEDGVSWNVIGELQFAGNPGFDPSEEVLVAPRIIRLRDEVDSMIYDVLLFTLERNGKDETGYVIGTLAANVFTVVGKARPIDFGHDFTRPRSTNYTPGTINEEERLSRAYIYGVMSDTGRGGDPTQEKNWASEGWANALTIPRRVTLQHGSLYQTPPAGLPDAVSGTERTKMWTGLCEIPSGSCVIAHIHDCNGNSAATITHRGDTIELDRLDGSPVSAAVGDEDEDNLTILVDGSTLEVFAGGGVVAMASRFWPEGGCSKISVHAEGDAMIHNEWQRGS